MQGLDFVIITNFPPGRNISRTLFNPSSILSRYSNERTANILSNFLFDLKERKSETTNFVFLIFAFFLASCIIFLEISTAVISRHLPPTLRVHIPSPHPISSTLSLIQSSRRGETKTFVRSEE